MTALIHADPRCLEISVAWCEMLRVARLERTFLPDAGLDLVGEPYRTDVRRWIQEALTTKSVEFSTRGWWVVPAFQLALSACWAHRGHLTRQPMSVYREILAAPRGDADTIACIAGGLIGALGADPAVLPAAELAKLHGIWPHPMRAADLAALEQALATGRAGL